MRLGGTALRVGPRRLPSNRGTSGLPRGGRSAFESKLDFSNSQRDTCVTLGPSQRAAYLTVTLINWTSESTAQRKNREECL